jgi:hypothetical protein
MVILITLKNLDYQRYGGLKHSERIQLLLKKATISLPHPHSPLFCFSEVILSEKLMLICPHILGVIEGGLDFVGC